MPNGISCAYFAARNLIYGTKEHNVFKEGIATAQTARTVDAVANSSALASSVPAGIRKGCSFFAKLARKILYPLIILSGVYNTATSKDKVKTGASQAAGIATMYCFETGLDKIQKKVVPNIISFASKKLPKRIVKTVSNLSKNLNSNKYAKITKYFLQGILFATVSMAGFNTGNKVAEKIVDKCRENKTPKVIDSYPAEYFEPQEDIFEDIRLQ